MKNSNRTKKMTIQVHKEYNLERMVKFNNGAIVEALLHSTMELEQPFRMQPLEEEMANSKPIPGVDRRLLLLPPSRLLGFLDRISHS